MPSAPASTDCFEGFGLLLGVLFVRRTPVDAVVSRSVTYLAEDIRYRPTSVVNTDTADYPIRVMSADGTTTIMRLDNSGNLLLGGATQNIGSQASYSLSVPTGIGVSGTTWGYLGIPDYLTLSGAGTWLVTRIGALQYCWFTDHESVVGGNHAWEQYGN
jgi:hypothetical protein